MKSCKPVYLQTALILISLFLSSCADHLPAEKENLILLSGSSGSLKWEIEYPEKAYYYSDLIPLSFKMISGEEGIPVNMAPDDSIPWGDFRIYSYDDSKGRLEILLQPIKTGQSILRIPAFQQDTESILEINPVEIDIKSFLEASNSELSPLIDVKDQSGHSLQLVIVILSVLVLFTVIFLLYQFFRKKHENVKEESLSDLVAGLEGSSEGEYDMDDLYRKIYRLLLKELLDIHPAVLASDGPAELMLHLEMPSPLNQWALRSLYPLLETMDTHFFHKKPEGRLEDKFKEDLNILKEWISFVESLNKEVNRKQ